MPLLEIECWSSSPQPSHHTDYVRNTKETVKLVNDEKMLLLYSINQKCVCVCLCVCVCVCVKQKLIGENYIEGH
jgi:hypothetical protein